MQNRNTLFGKTKYGAYKGAKIGLLGSLGITIPFSFLVMYGEDSPPFCSKSTLILFTLIAGGVAGLSAGASTGAALGATNAVVSRAFRKR